MATHLVAVVKYYVSDDGKQVIMTRFKGHKKPIPIRLPRPKDLERHLANGLDLPAR